MKRKVIIPYKPKLKEVARKLRKSGTLSEVLLWTYLKKKKIRGYDFDRQKPLGNYIVDFFCNELMLAIEIDGCSHNEKSEEDRIRQAKLESLGVRFLRFHDSDIKKNIQGVLWVIDDWIRKHKDEPTPNPSQEGKKKDAGYSRGVNKYTPAPSQEGSKHTPNPLSRGEYKSPLLGGELGVGNTGGDLGVGSFLQQELEKVKTSYPTCTDFERNFPSLCFALATGVGKTRLMGAFVVYLYLAKNIRNFFVLAPNLTIYNKLIDDFVNINSPKYIFQCIGEFVHSRPRIITGDNYEDVRQAELFKYEIHVNIFNIGKINAETRGGKSPRIKRLTECLGISYFNYLTSLDDLVVLMDESHHYRADRGKEVINELNPIIGLELTATPQVERGGEAIKFKNVVYEYSLAKAIRDGFVKEPAVATRKDFDPTHYTQEDLDRIKLEDGVR